MELPLELSKLVILEASAFVQGMAKAGIPGLGVLAVPLAALALPAKASTGVVLPALILGDAIGVGYWRRAAEWRCLLRALPWAVAGVVAGYFLMGRISDAQLRPAIGVIILGMLLLHIGRTWWRKRHPAAPAPDAGNGAPLDAKARAEAELTARQGSPLRRRLFAAFMGFTGGVTTMLANAAGPVMSMYLLALRLPKAVFIGTSAWFFLIINWTKVPFSAKLGLINAHSLVLNLWMVPLLLVGIVIGIKIVKRIPERGFEILVQVLTAVAAVRLLF